MLSKCEYYIKCYESNNVAILVIALSRCIKPIHRVWVKQTAELEAGSTSCATDVQEVEVSFYYERDVEK